MTTSPRPPDDRTGTEPAELQAIAQAMSRWRLLIGRRIIGRMTIDRMAPDLELSHLDVIEAVRRSQGEATVGGIAEAMRIDPSRSSRLIAELVQRGILRRTVSQADARRSVVELTEKTAEMLAEMHLIKMEMLESLLLDWSGEEIAQFATLFARFVEGFESLARSREPKPVAGSRPAP